MTVPFLLSVLVRHRSASMTVPSRMTCDQPSSATLERRGQLRGLRGECVDGLVQVAIRGGLEIPNPLPVSATLRRSQNHTITNSACVKQPSALVPRRVPGMPLRGQQRRDEGNQFPRDVEYGAIGDHVEPFRSEVDLCQYHF